MKTNLWFTPIAKNSTYTISFFNLHKILHQAQIQCENQDILFPPFFKLARNSISSTKWLKISNFQLSIILLSSFSLIIIFKDIWYPLMLKFIRDFFVENRTNSILSPFFTRHQRMKIEKGFSEGGIKYSKYLKRMRFFSLRSRIFVSFHSEIKYFFPSFIQFKPFPIASRVCSSHYQKRNSHCSDRVRTVKRGENLDISQFERNQRNPLKTEIEGI